MSASELRARHIAVEDDGIRVYLEDGREFVGPLSSRLRSASTRDRHTWEVVGHGVGIRWPSIDEDLSVAGLYRDRLDLDSNDE